MPRANACPKSYTTFGQLYVYRARKEKEEEERRHML
jgi:hypothetical protein